MDAHQIKAHLMNFRFLFIVPFVQHGLFEIFLLQKVTPKIQSWTPRPRWSYRCLASRKIAPFQSRISFKWLSARNWHWFCPSKPVFSTDPQVHGWQNPLLYTELDCIQFVIRPPDAILDPFTGLHPLGSLKFFDFARKHAEQSKRDSKFSFGWKKWRSPVVSVMGPRHMHIVHNCMFWPCTGIPANIPTSSTARYKRFWQQN